MKNKLLPVILMLFFSASAFAHEYWLEPDKFFLAPDEKTAVRLFVGDGLKKEEEKPFQISRTNLFRLFSLKNDSDLKKMAANEAMPIYNFSAGSSGDYLLALERNWSYIKLDAQKFEDYLREDGMEYVIGEREKLGERAMEGRERYSRFIKTILQVGERRGVTYKKKVGLKMEIIPLENPYSKKRGDQLKLQILFDGKPLADKSVFADSRDGEQSTNQKLKTDSNGKIVVKLERSGVWLIRLVFMRRCEQDCAETDWESYWGAFSFGVK